MKDMIRTAGVFILTLSVMACGKKNSDAKKDMFRIYSVVIDHTIKLSRLNTDRIDIVLRDSITDFKYEKILKDSVKHDPKFFELAMGRDSSFKGFILSNNKTSLKKILLFPGSLSLNGQVKLKSDTLTGAIHAGADVISVSDILFSADARMAMMRLWDNNIESIYFLRLNDEDWSVAHTLNMAEY